MFRNSAVRIVLTGAWFGFGLHAEGEAVAVLVKPGCAAYEQSLAVKRPRQGPSREDLRACIESMKSKLAAISGVAADAATGTLATTLEAVLRTVPAVSGAVLVADPTVPARGDQLSRYLFRLHRLYQDLKHEDKNVVTLADRPDIILLGAELHRVMDNLRLREPFAAALDTGLTITDAGNSTLPYAKPGTDKIPYGMIDWESRHFFEHGRTDWSFGGRMGLLPTMTLVHRSDEKPTPVEGKATPAWPMHPLFQNAFHWDVNGRLNVHAGDSSEVSFLARGGQSQLLSETEAIETTTPHVSTSLIDNGPARTAWLWDVGPEFRLFDNPLDNVHEDKTYHSPVFLVGAGVRRNQRFRRGGPLTNYSNPEMRWFFKFSISLNKIVDRRATGAEPKSFSMGFAVEHEGPLHRGGPLDRTVPSGTRIVLTADFDVLSKLRRAEAK